MFTAGAAGIALKTARTAERIAAQGVEATKRQTSLAAIQELWNDYASLEKYEALRRFGRFVNKDERVRERFAHLRDQFQQHGLKLQSDSSSNDNLSWVVTPSDDTGRKKKTAPAPHWSADWKLVGACQARCGRVATVVGGQPVTRGLGAPTGTRCDEPSSSEGRSAAAHAALYQAPATPARRSTETRLK